MIDRLLLLLFYYYVVLINNKKAHVCFVQQGDFCASATPTRTLPAPPKVASPAAALRLPPDTYLPYRRGFILCTSPRLPSACPSSHPAVIRPDPALIFFLPFFLSFLPSFFLFLLPLLHSTFLQRGLLWACGRSINVTCSLSSSEPSSSPGNSVLPPTTPPF